MPPDPAGSGTARATFHGRHDSPGRHPRSEGGLLGYRDFTDAEGTSWSTWDVVPELVERRAAPRRGQRTPGVPGFVGTIDGRERRVGIERRMVRSRRTAPGDGFAGGWLCFECSAEKRRLSPIPSDWQRCREAQLAAYCAQATPVRAGTSDTRLLPSTSTAPGSALGNRTG